VHRDDRERVKAQLEGLAESAEGSNLDLEYRITTADARHIDVRSAVRVHRADDDTIVLRGISLNVTGQKKLEIELRQAQKLESVGRLASGVAHEINTPVQFVSDNLHFLRDAMRDLAVVLQKYRSLHHTVVEGLPALDAATEVTHAERDADFDYLLENMPSAVDRSIDGLDRVATIVRSMKEFAHPDSKEMCSVDLNQAIRSTLVIARNEYKYVAEVETDFGEIPPVLCHAGDVNQAVLNIIVNAGHAIGDVVAHTNQMGRIAVQTRQEDELVVIRISDTGGGIPENVRNRIFDPFFTTKDVGKGTGQGLAIARSVIQEKHGGDVTFETETGVGTTFIIRLPIGGRTHVIHEAAA
jgi:signal transduction histidine kinase